MSDIPYLGIFDNNNMLTVDTIVAQRNFGFLWVEREQCHWIAIEFNHSVNIFTSQTIANNLLNTFFDLSFLLFQIEHYCWMRNLCISGVSLIDIMYQTTNDNEIISKLIIHYFICYLLLLLHHRRWLNRIHIDCHRNEFCHIRSYQ